MKPTEPTSSERPRPASANSTIRHFAARRLLPFVALVLCLGGLVAVGRAFPEGVGDVEDAARPLPVAIGHPEAVDGYDRARAFTGEVRARRTVALGFEVAGRVLEVAVDEGDVVQKGAPLARIDTRRLQTERRRLAAAKEEADAVHAEMRAGPREEVVDAARAAVRDLDTQVALLGRKAERRERLLAQKTISDEEYDEIQSLLVSLEARRAGAKAKLSELERGTRPETLAAQAARIAGLDAQLARLDLDLDDGVLRAPFDARVLRRHADEGAVAVPGSPIVAIVEDGVLEAWIGVPPAVALGVAPGSSHVVRVGERAFDATVQAKLPQTDAATRTQAIVFRLPATARDAAVPGQIARLELSEWVEAPGFWVPASALTRGVRGLWAVYALEPREGNAGWRALRHPVEVLFTYGDRALVRGTIDATSRIVTGNAEKLAPGQPVAPTGSDA